MRKKTKITIDPKYILAGLFVFCIILGIISFRFENKMTPVRSAVSSVIAPMQKGINAIGVKISERMDYATTLKKTVRKNKKLQSQIDKLSAENKLLQQDKYELENFRKLYDLDQQYAGYPKVAARVISSDPDNWYNTFIIDKGSKNGLKKNMNVMANGGLVGIITEVNKSYSKVRSIIDDSSNVSATVTSISQNCMVTGDLQMMDDGKIRFIQLTDKEDQVQEGDKIVTSSVSNKFLKGILIGYISEVSTDANKLTKSGTIIPAVDFNDIQEVLVIKELKQQKTEDVTSEESQTPDDSTTPTPDPTQDAQEDEQ